MNTHTISYYQKKNENANYPILLCGIIALLICLGAYSKAFIIVALICAVISMLFMQKKNGLATLFFLLPFSPAFKMGSTEVSFFTVLIAIYCVITLLREGSLAKSVVVPLFMAIYLVLNGSIANTSRYLDIILGLLLIYIVFSGKQIDVNYIGLLRMFSFGIILSCFIALASEYIGFFAGITQEIAFVEYGGNEYERFRALYTNSNYFTLDITITASCYLAILALNGSLAKSDWMMLALLVLFGIMSASMSFFLSLVVIILITCVYMLRSNLRGLLRMVVVILFLSGVIFFLLRQGNHSALWMRINELINTDTSVLETTTGRGGLWETYWEYITSHPSTMLFGDGLNAPNIGSRGRGSHNTYLDLVYYFGILGTGLFIISVIFPWKSGHGRAHKELCVYIPLCALVIRAFAISILFINNLYFCFIMIMMAISTTESIKHNEISRE